MTFQRSRSIRLLTSCVSLAAAGAAFAGPEPTITVLAVEGEAIAGVGVAQQFHRVRVGDDGTWLIHLRVDGQELTIRNGEPVVRAGDPLPPVGAAAGFISSADLTGAGGAASIIGLAGQPVGANEGLYVDTGLLIQRGGVSQAPQFTPGTVYTDLIEARTNAANHILMLAVADDSATPYADQALVRLTLDPSGGLATETVLHRRGQVPAGESLAIQNFGSTAASFALGGPGDSIFLAELATGVNANAVIRNNAVVAREGGPSPVPGREWASLHLSAYVVGMNSAGDFVFSGRLTGDTATDAVIVRNGAVFKQRGGTFPAIAPATLSGGFTTAPLFITDGGEVVWYGDWGGSGLLVNETVLLRAGGTTIGGETVASIASGANGFHVSPSGRYVIARVTLDAGATDAVVLLDRGEPASCPADWNLDNVVNSGDISAFLTSWLASVQAPDLAADFNGDGQINSGDISAFLTAWLDAVTEGC